MKMNMLSAGAICAAVLLTASSAFCAGQSPDSQSPALEVNNAWHVFETKNIKSPLFVTLKHMDAHWEIAGIYEAPPQIARDDSRELFIASRDLQQWGAYGPQGMTGCDSFEAREYPYKTVCSSVFAERKAGRAALGILLYKLSTNGVPVGYDVDKVTTAIHSIRPEQAQAILTAVERQ
ncbi:hypothetical protein VSR68_24900 [Paraburkholderia phymatum]|uniref:hypothetical protein n=1 Tax=Paraburkholderia phymatum TaxID=148447 RepID=UPI00317DAE16